jgi:hypothetical protein
VGIVTANSNAWKCSVWERSLALIVYSQTEISKTSASTYSYYAGGWEVISSAVSKGIEAMQMRLTLV